MNNVKKLGIYFLSLTLMLSLIPVQPLLTFAEDVDPEFLDEEIVLFAESQDEEIDLFENLLDEDSILSIPDQTEATLLYIVENDEYSLIRYTYINDQDEEVQIEGYVHNSTIVPSIEADQFREDRDLELQEKDIEADENEAKEEKQEEADENEVKEENQEEVDVDSNSDKAKRSDNKEEIVDEKAQQVNTAKIQETKELKNGVRDKRVIQLKKDLAKLGFPVPGNGTSLFGPDTEQKVKEFQKYFGIKETGTVTDETQKKIEQILASPLQKEKRHQNTVQLKKDLAFLNFQVPGNGTTLYGTETEKRVQEFQKKYGLVINGIADEVTLAKIEELKKAPLSDGMRREDVKTLKKNLEKLGFKVPGNGTNLYGKQTTKKVKEFQKYFGIKETGTVTDETQKKIEQILASPLQKGKRHQDTVQLKKDLAFLNFSVPGNGTTLYGAQTEKRVKDFQKKYGLVVNGIADEVTLAKIAELKKNPLSKGMRRGDVVTLKKNLAKFGFKVPGNGTNYFGADTEAKVKEFQKYYGIKQTGTINDETKNLLNTPLQNGKRHANTKQLKKDLKRLGFTVPGDGTTLFGTQTEKKVKEFQRYYGIKKVNGIADNVTLAKIKSILNSPLQNGKRHKDTVKLKENLALLGYPVPGNGTTLFGADTEKKVKEFQKANNLAVNGIADEITLAKIDELLKSSKVYSNYDLSLEDALKIQMKAGPQTDKKYAYVSSAYINGNNKVTADVLNVRSGAGTDSFVVGQLKKGSTVKILSEYQGWYVIEFNGSRQWVDASPEDVLYYLNPDNFINDSKQQFQFLDLARPSGASVAVLNKYLAQKGILANKAKAFIDAASIHGVNDIYLISHSILETGNGKSELSNGVEVGKDKNDKLVLVNSKNKSSLKEIKKVYNMYGIGAYDNCALECGAKKAYEKDWTTPEKAIIGGAEFIGTSYIKVGQNTLYKMRWNPLFMSEEGSASHQYATDIGWASKQINTMYNLYQEIGYSTPFLDIPVYKK